MIQIIRWWLRELTAGLLIDTVNLCVILASVALPLGLVCLDVWRLLCGLDQVALIIELANSVGLDLNIPQTLLAAVRLVVCVKVAVLMLREYVWVRVPEFHILLINTGVARSTKLLVERVRQRHTMVWHVCRLSLLSTLHIVRGELDPDGYPVDFVDLADIQILCRIHLTKPCDQSHSIILQICGSGPDYSGSKGSGSRSSWIWKSLIRCIHTSIYIDYTETAVSLKL